MENVLSPADVAVLSGNTGSNRNNDGFGDNGSWWIIIFLIFAFMGWGRNGFGGNGNGSDGSGSGMNYTLASDFATLQRQLDSGFDRVATGINSVNNGLCDGFYNMAQQFSNTNQNIFNGNAGLQQSLCQGFAGVNTAITTNGYESRLATQGLSSQLADCCCKTQSSIADLGYRLQDCCCQTQRSIDGVNYNMAMNTNALQSTLCNNTRDLIENQNANYRALHDEIVANRIEDKNAQIQAQQNEINALRLSASQANQNAVLRAAMDANTAEIIRRTGNDCPVNAVVVQPNTPVTFPTNCCGQFNGYGCNNGCGNY